MLRSPQCVASKNGLRHHSAARPVAFAADAARAAFGSGQSVMSAMRGRRNIRPSHSVGLAWYGRDPRGARSTDANSAAVSGVVAGARVIRLAGFFGVLCITRP